MSCRKYYDGLCIGGNCYNCKDNPDRLVKKSERKDNMFLGLFMIGFGITVLLIVAVFL